MDFRYKAILQGIFSKLPGGGELNFLCQTKLTRSLPVPYEEFKKGYHGKVEGVFQDFLQYSDGDEKICDFYYEFGAGWDLETPIGFSELGAKKLEVIDIKELIKPSLIRNTVQNYNRLLHRTENIQIPSDMDGLKSFLEQRYRIHYHIGDASDTKIPEGTVSLIVSHATFEHIPEASVENIMRECSRILSPEGVAIFTIDYRDHYSYFDKNLSPYNYMKYSEQQWKKYNSDIQYQNRLRHSDYREFILRAGFKIVKEEKRMPAEAEETQLRGLALDQKFQNDSFEDLKILGGYFVLKKR